MDRGKLLSEIRRKRLTSKEVTVVFAQLVLMLEGLQRHNILPQNLTLDHIELDIDGNIAFDLSSLFDPTNISPKSLNFPCPDQLRGQPIKLPSLIHILGSMLYYILSGYVSPLYRSIFTLSDADAVDRPTDTFQADLQNGQTFTADSDEGEAQIRSSRPTSQRERKHPKPLRTCRLYFTYFHRYFSTHIMILASGVQTQEPSVY